MWQVGTSARNLFIVLEGAVRMVTNFLGGPAQALQDLPAHVVAAMPDRSCACSLLHSVAWWPVIRHTEGRVSSQCTCLHLAHCAACAICKSWT